MDHLKSTVGPQKQITPREHIKGLVDDYGDITEDVLLLEGETHLSRKPVSSAKRDVRITLICRYSIVCIGRSPLHFS